jgi:hypothetical protein
LLGLVVACEKPARKEPPAGATGKLAGDYRIKSASLPGGATGAYGGTVAIRQTGSHYTIDWKIRDNLSYTGVAIETGEFLAAGWSEIKNSAVIVYEMNGGTMSGHWASPEGDGKLGSEELAGSNNLSGSYDIVSGYTPRGESYGGKASISPHGNVYRMIWERRGVAENGVAIKKGNRLFAARGGNGAAVMVYTLTKSGALSGQWAQPSGAQLGTEFLTR